MNTRSKNRVVDLNKVVIITVAITLCFTIVPGFKTAARAHKGAAFLGGMVADHVVSGFVRRDKRRTRAMEREAYDQPRTVQQAAPAPAPAAKPTAQQRIQELDKLAAGGYITPQEYKAKKKAILDSLYR